MIYRFGVFEFDPATGILSRAGRTVALEPQPARALALLLSRGGEIVTREELRAQLWGADTHVDFDRGLAYCVGQLRTALGDTAINPRFVQTLPKRGFKFVAPVTQAVPMMSAATAETTLPASIDHRNSRSRRPSSAWIAVAGAVAVIALAAAWALMHRTPAPRSIVAVAVFDNESGDPSHERAVAGLSDVIVERLTAIGPARIGVNGNAHVLREPRAARDLKAVVQDTRAAFLVSGQLQNREGHLSLLMQLIRLDDGTHVWVQRISRPAGDPLDTLDDDVGRMVEDAVRRFVLVPQPRA
ncbi:MAG TPA: winged helix-turn-helix domain-containing protein [Vicinamibacterales bacterium]